MSSWSLGVSSRRHALPQPRDGDVTSHRPSGIFKAEVGPTQRRDRRLPAWDAARGPRHVPSAQETLPDTHWSLRFLL